MGTIRIINASGQDEIGSKSVLGDSVSQAVSEVDTAVLQNNLNSLVTDLSGVLDNLEQNDGFKLKQFTVGQLRI